MSAAGPRSAAAATFADIEEILRAAGPPAPGHRRVFRGQTRAWLTKDGGHTITPALGRTAQPACDPSWVTRMTRSIGADALAQGDGVPPELFLVWSPALIQQYGPGSFFVDVTFDPATALWFAFHEWQSRISRALIGTDVTGMYHRDIPLAWYRPLRGAAAGTVRPVLYVFDLPEWDGNILPLGVSVVDPWTSPVSGWIETQSTRLGAQHAALVHANARFTDHGDIGPFASLAIELADRFDRSTVPGLERPTHAIFPTPDRDPFYAQLLALPAQQCFDPTRLQHPLNVYWYVSGDTPADDEMRPFLQACTHLRPPLLHAGLAQADGAHRFPGSAGVDGRTVLFADALPILLESVLLTSTPPVSAGGAKMWNETVLASDIAATLADRSTGNVYVEFAPIDVAGPEPWSVTGFPRAAWLVRTGSAFDLHLFFAFDRISWSHVRFDPGSDGMTARIVGGERVDVDMARKALYVTLALLRDLSPGEKPRPMAGLVTDGRVHPGVERVPQRAALQPIARGRYFVARDPNGRPYALGLE